MAGYSNFQAASALIKASLQSILKSPSAVVFSIIFPLVFILVFGFVGNVGSNFNLTVAPSPGADTSMPIFRVLLQQPQLHWDFPASQDELERSLTEGQVLAAIDIVERPGRAPLVQVNGNASRFTELLQLQTVIEASAIQTDPDLQQRVAGLMDLDLRFEARKEYKMIDFILPGQLGFSLLAAGVFGTAFVFFNLRQTLVLKRFFATPVRREVIVLSEGIARLVFQMMGAVIIISLGYYFFGFTLVEGWLTFLKMLLVCALGMMIFMGFGFVISGIAKSEATIPPLSNIITLPQFLLAGTFFPVEVFPSWLQPVCKILPLTYLNDALRRISFEGAGLFEIRWDLAILLLWGVVVYLLAARLFKWE